MFTGIIEHLGKIEALERNEDGGRLKIGLADAKSIAAEIKVGASIAVNGCCLTAVDVRKTVFSADLSAETLRKTSLAGATIGRIVNLELPLPAGARLGGHFVQGHVDAVGRVERINPEGDNWWLGIRVPEDLRRYVAEKGSLAVDGISLTVARWHDSVAEFAIIPHTYANTNLREITVGDSVNLECDILAKYVESLFKGRAEAVPQKWTVDKLVQEGF
ncbi:MAG TPA: riboflavin synthase [Candidatus Acidoferrales bacterium]|nr:riboflavin synthase [Candidatus Acidoferrales bacterium]